MYALEPYDSINYQYSNAQHLTRLFALVFGYEHIEFIAGPVLRKGVRAKSISPSVVRNYRRFGTGESSAFVNFSSLLHNNNDCLQCFRR